MAGQGATGPTGAAASIVADFGVSAGARTLTLKSAAQLLVYDAAGSAGQAIGVGTENWNASQNTFVTPVEGPYNFILAVAVQSPCVGTLQLFAVINDAPLLIYTLQVDIVTGSLPLRAPVGLSLQAGDRVAFAAAQPPTAGSVVITLQNTSLEVESLGF
jgi:hypothetical protein